MKRLIGFVGLLLLSFNVHAQEYVDLGLSVNWATYNVGAINAEEVGTPFVIGTTIKWDREGMALENFVTHKEDFSGNPEYDAAAALWGNGWRTPTEAEWKELLYCCKWKKIKLVTDSGMKVPGHRITGPNGNSIFLPFSPYRKFKIGIYQSSTPWPNPKFQGVIGLCPPMTSFAYTIKHARQLDLGFYIRPVKNK